MITLFSQFCTFQPGNTATTPPPNPPRYPARCNPRGIRAHNKQEQKRQQAVRVAKAVSSPPEVGLIVITLFMFFFFSDLPRAPAPLFDHGLLRQRFKVRTTAGLIVSLPTDGQNIKHLIIQGYVRFQETYKLHPGYLSGYHSAKRRIRYSWSYPSF